MRILFKIQHDIIILKILLTHQIIPQVRTEAMKNNLNPDWLADFKLSVMSEDSHLLVRITQTKFHFSLLNWSIVAVRLQVGCNVRVIPLVSLVLVA